MRVLIIVVAVIIAAIVIARFCSKCNSNSSSSNLARTIYEKFIGIGSVNSLDNIHHITVIT